MEGQEFGAGSRVFKNQRRVSNIARYGVTKPKYSLLLQRLIRHVQATNIIELGTSLGLNTAYLSLADDKAQITSFEGNMDLVDIAEGNLETLDIHNAAVIPGNIDQSLKQFLDSNQKIDLAFLDANHTGEATIRYIMLMKPHLHHDSVLVIDDIYWSRDMTMAWKQLKSLSWSFLALNLFQMGILFVNPRFEKKEYFLQY